MNSGVVPLADQRTLAFKLSLEVLREDVGLGSKRFQLENMTERHCGGESERSGFQGVIRSRISLFCSVDVLRWPREGLFGRLMEHFATESESESMLDTVVATEPKQASRSSSRSQFENDIANARCVCLGHAQ